MFDNYIFDKLLRLVFHLFHKFENTNRNRTNTRANDYIKR